MDLRLNKAVLLALMAALAVVLAAWFVPLPPIIAGEEALAAKTIPTDRSNTQIAAEQFRAANDNYRAYIKTHDLGALLLTAREAITQAKAAPTDDAKLAAVRDATSQVLDY